MKKIPLFDAHCDSISRFLTNERDSLKSSAGHLDLERVSSFVLCAAGAVSA